MVNQCRTCGTVLADEQRRGRPREYCDDICRRKPIACTCGAPSRSGRCLACFRSTRSGPRKPYGKRLKPVACRSCGRTFQPESRYRVSCSKACWLTYVVLNSAEKTLRVRLRRRRACAIRYKRGGKPVAGRWRLICERDGNVCWICGEAIDLTVAVQHLRAGTADHVIPLALGGSDDESNLRAAHYSCNNRRGCGRSIHNGVASA